jgi:hypothetical protein
MAIIPYESRSYKKNIFFQQKESTLLTRFCIICIHLRERKKRYIPREKLQDGYFQLISLISNLPKKKSVKFWDESS